MFIGNKKCRIYAACGVSQTPKEPYKLRGENRQKAIEQGKETEYNRLALMMVSVFHLSHWRLDVTVTNYLI